MALLGELLKILAVGIVLEDIGGELIALSQFVDHAVGAAPGVRPRKLLRHDEPQTVGIGQVILAIRLGLDLFALGAKQIPLGINLPRRRERDDRQNNHGRPRHTRKRRPETGRWLFFAVFRHKTPLICPGYPDLRPRHTALPYASIFLFFTVHPLLVLSAPTIMPLRQKWRNLTILTVLSAVGRFFPLTRGIRPLLAVSAAGYGVERGPFYRIILLWKVMVTCRRTLTGSLLRE